MKQTGIRRNAEAIRAWQDRSRSELRRTKPLKPSGGSLSKGGGDGKRASISPASDAQREKAREQPCIVTEAMAVHGATVDPAHLWPRGRGGCDDPLCVVPLRRDLHRQFDDGEFDLLPHLRPHYNPRAFLPELLHALDHADGDLLGLLHRLTGERHYPKEEQ